MDNSPDPANRSGAAWLQQHAVAVGAVALVAMSAVVVLAIALVTREEPSPSAATSPSSETPEPQTASLVAVKIDNAERARPQVGLNAARYVFEVPVEGGMTRFLAFFEPGDVLVGPVRSARPVDVDLVGVLSETLISTGGRPFVLGALRGNDITLVGDEADGSPLQTLERPAPHNQFVVLADVGSGPTAGGIPIGELPEGETTEAAVEIGDGASVTWTLSDGIYSRSEGGEAFMVLPDWGAEPEPLTADTVVAMEVNQRSAGYQDVNGVGVPTFDVIGSGDLRVYHLGTEVHGRWERASLDAGYVFRTADGEAFGLPPGRTFIHLSPTG